jgi:hypothetical protein
VQQAAGQRLTANNIETMGIASCQNTFSSNVVADFRGMVRDNAIGFNSNGNSTPIEVFQHNFFREAYFKGTIIITHGRNEWKFGVESDNTFLNENLWYHITDPTQFDAGTPIDFSFLASRPYFEQSVFVQNQITSKTLDDQRRAALGPLSALAKLAWGAVAPFDLALFSFRHTSVAFLL